MRTSIASFPFRRVCRGRLSARQNFQNSKSLAPQNEIELCTQIALLIVDIIVLRESFVDHDNNYIYLERKSRAIIDPLYRSGIGPRGAIE